MAESSDNADNTAADAFLQGGSLKHARGHTSAATAGVGCLNR
ncbi:hypothetical protein AHiyo4_20780 [Arthrobacter sp. Hiyo4]|nr:hypothetical protein AHiyo4_20780 [Arthrobacter sp. Hiyo4]